jgi:lysophospholipase L1-like esterase
MRSVSWLRCGMTGMALAVGLATSARADDPPNCEVPPYLLATESPLPKVAEAVKSRQAVDILVVGSRSSTINTSEASAYPTRLQVALKDRLPAVTVNLSVELQPKKTAEELAGSFVKLVEEKKPNLVIWQTGTVDAMRSIDPDEFRSAVDEGVSALQKAGADVILMNLQYSPRTETMISVPPYIDNLRAVAQERDVPLFDRFAIMHQWNEQGDFDLFNPTHGLELAKQVHDCIGRALSKFIIDAAHLGPAQQN